MLWAECGAVGWIWRSCSGLQQALRWACLFICVCCLLAGPKAQIVHQCVVLQVGCLWIFIGTRLHVRAVCRSPKKELAPWMLQVSSFWGSSDGLSAHLRRCCDLEAITPVCKLHVLVFMLSASCGCIPSCAQQRVQPSTHADTCFEVGPPFRGWKPLHVFVWVCKSAHL